MTDPKPARAADEQTFEEARRQYLALDPSTSSAQLSVWEHGWYARDQAVRHLEERIGELECQVGIEQKGAVGLLERLDRVRALAEKWNLEAAGKLNLCCHRVCADEIERALSEE